MKRQFLRCKSLILYLPFSTQDFATNHRYMLPRKEDRHGENLWDEPVTASDETNYKKAKPTVLLRIVHFVVDIASAFVTLTLISIANYNFTAAFKIRLDLFEELLQSSFALPALYFILVFTFEALTKGQSIGKLVTGFTAQRVDENPFRIEDAFLRTICRLIPFEFLWIFFRQDQRALHDVLSATEIRLKTKKQLPREDDVVFD